MPRSEKHLANLHEHGLRFREILAPLVRRTHAFSALISRQSAPGTVRSRRQAAGGIEREFPRAFHLEDDPALLDFGRIDASLVCAPAWALLNGSLRVMISSAESELECIVMIDLSRSMLSDSLAGNLADPENPPAKLASLYAAAGSVVGHAEACGFRIRVIFLQGGRLDIHASRTPRDFALTVLSLMSRYQVKSFEASLREKATKEQFQLAEGCAFALNRRRSGVVVIISDFLDPLDHSAASGLKCEPLLRQLAQNHRCIAIDLATPEENAFPEPRFWEQNSLWTPCRFGARHLELGMELRYLGRGDIRRWNEERDRNRGRLRDLLKRSGTERLLLPMTSFQSVHQSVVSAFNRLR